MAISDAYHIRYEENRLWEKTSWLGVNIQKNPCDLLVMQELIFQVKPDLIIETGARAGGSALFFASILNLIGYGEVISVDKTLEHVDFAQVDDHHFAWRIQFLTGESISSSVLSAVRERVPKCDKVMVFLDSWHSEKYVAAELDAYKGFVTPGSYMIVEDTHINNPVTWKHKDRGPAAAVEAFLIENHNFATDYTCEKLVFTFNPGGYLRRVY